VRFRFIGKSGKEWSLRVRDRRIAKIISGDVQSLKPEEAAVLALLRGRLAKEAERPAAKKQRAKAA
jgi:DNA topoisomerase IB